MEPSTGIEPVLSPLPRACFTTKLRRPFRTKPDTPSAAFAPTNRSVMGAVSMRYGSGATFPQSDKITASSSGRYTTKTSISIGREATRNAVAVAVHTELARR
jgi:hypothetical protein